MVMQVAAWAAVVYMIGMALILNTSSTASAVWFKVIPFVIGMSLLVGLLK